MGNHKWVGFGVLVVFLALGVVLAGCGAKEKAGEEQEQATPVALAEVSKGRLDRGDILTGKLAAATQVDLVPKVPGKVASVTVDVGDRVSAGQVVLRLDAPETAAAVTLAESGLKTAEINYQAAKTNYERGKLLVAQQAIAQADFETMYENPYKLAKENFERTAPAQLAQAQANYSNTILKAPVSGVVTARTVDPGEMASQSVPVLSIVNIDTVFVETTASEAQVNRLKPGQEVVVEVKAVGDKTLKGKIETVSPAANAQSRVYPVKVRLDNPGGLLKPGMFATVDLGSTGATLLIPRDAIVSRDDKQAVFVAEGDKAVLREVRVGESDGKNIAVISGLKEGERVVISGQSVLSDGAKILVADQEAEK